MSSADVGTHDLSYNYTDSVTGCFNSDTISFDIVDIPQLELVRRANQSAPLVHCLGDTVHYLKLANGAEDFNASSFLYGNGFATTSTDIYDPDLAGVGFDTITYQSTDSAGCFNQIDTVIEVQATADASFTIADTFVCVHPEDSVAIIPTNTGGTFDYLFNTVPGVDTVYFDLGDFWVDLDTMNYIQYVYDDGSGCADTVVKAIMVNDTPDVVISNVEFNYCVNQGQHTLYVDAPSLGSSYFRSFAWDNSFVKEFNNMIDSTVLTTGVDSTVFIPRLIKGADTVKTDTFSLVEYIHVDVNGCKGISQEYIDIFQLPELSINMFDYGNGVSNLSSDAIFCASQEYATMSGLATSIPGQPPVANLPNGYFTASAFGQANSFVTTDSSSAGQYTPTVDDFYVDTVTYHFTDAWDCYNNVKQLMDVRKLPPDSFDIIPGPNPSAKNLCPVDIGTTLTEYDAVYVPLGIGNPWPTVDVKRRWYANGDSAVTVKQAGKFNPGTGTNDDSTRYNNFNTMTFQIWDETGNIDCYAERTDSFYVDSFPIVDVFPDSLYCSNDGQVVLKATPGSGYGSGVNIPSVFSSTNMYGGAYADTMFVPGQDSIIVDFDLFNPTNTNGGASNTYNVNYDYTDPLTNCAAQKTKTFILKIKPTLGIVAANKDFCPYDSPIQVTFTAQDGLSGVGATDSASGRGFASNIPVGGSLTYDPTTFLGDTSTIRDIITYYYTDADGCYNQYSDSSFFVRAQPILNLIIDPSLAREDSVCFDDQNVDLFIQYWDTTKFGGAGFEFYSTLNGQSHPTDPSYFEFESSPGTFSQPSGGPISTEFDPSLDSKNDQDGVTTRIRFTGTIYPNGGCTADISDSIVTQPKPIADFSIDGVCSKYAPTLDGSLSIFDTANFSPSDGISRFIWEVDGVLATDSNPADTLVIYNYPRALSPDPHDFQLTVMSKKGCLSKDSLKEITFVEAPNAQFTWNMDDECLGQTVTFDGSATTTPDPNVQYNWYFGDGASDTTSVSAQHSYSNAQLYKVILEVGDTECRDSIEKDIYIRPVFDSKWQFPFVENFDSTYSGWVAWQEEFNPLDTVGGYNPTSFTWGDNRTVGSIQSKPGNNAWYLDYEFFIGVPEYHNRTQASVVGPCFAFDVDSITRPMLKLSSIYNMEENDGFVVQYTTDKDKPLEQVEWKNIGEYFVDKNTHYETGIEWYNKENIFGNPGGQTDKQGKIGWTNISTADPSDLSDTIPIWKESRHAIDSVLGKDYVRFRIAFGSNADAHGEGFIFDDFIIEERKKNVVFEVFTNSSKPEFATHMTNYDATIATLPDALDIQFHTSFPGTDPMNQDNAIDPSGRSLFYGVSSVPYVFGDGNKFVGFTFDNSFNEAVLKPRALEDPMFTVNMDYDPTTRMLNTNVSGKASLDSARSVTLHVALVEKEIAASEFGTNSNIAQGFNSFRNVLKRMYPSAAGTNYTMGPGDNNSLSTEIKFENFYSDPTDPDNYTIVAFVQDRNTQEIYQANWIGAGRNSTVGEPEYENIVDGGVEYVMYPNPTKGLTYMRFDQQLESSYQLNIYNQVGVLVNQEIIPAGTTQYSFDINGLPAGMYFIMMNNGEHEVAIKKLMLTQ